MEKSELTKDAEFHKLLGEIVEVREMLCKCDNQLSQIVNGLYDIVNKDALLVEMSEYMDKKEAAIKQMTKRNEIEHNKLLSGML